MLVSERTYLIVENLSLDILCLLCLTPMQASQAREDLARSRSRCLSFARIIYERGRMISAQCLLSSAATLRQNTDVTLLNRSLELGGGLSCLLDPKPPTTLRFSL